MAAQVSSLRPQITEDEIKQTMAIIEAKLRRRLAKKGWGAYASRHEILGIVTEEFFEAVEAVRENDEIGYQHYTDELLDIAVAAGFGMTSMLHGHIHP